MTITCETITLTCGRRTNYLNTPFAGFRTQVYFKLYWEQHNRKSNPIHPCDPSVDVRRPTSLLPSSQFLSSIVSHSHQKLQNANTQSCVQAMRQ